MAPNQFELAPIFEDVNLANDHNQLVMDLMKRIASKHNFTVLLHEKPFKGVNGSGKHNNWSLCTDTGINLFSPAKTAEGNMLFLTFIVNVLMMVYKNQDLLRASIVSAGNSHRLGANEAPPAILSIFLGRHLSHMLDEVVARLNDAELTLMKRKHCNWVSGAYLPYCKTIQTVTVPLLLPSPETVLNSVLQAHLPTVPHQ